MLAESDGMEDEPQWTILAWPVARIVEENLGHLGPEWPFAEDGPWADRLCFADSGGGEDFFFDVAKADRAVYVWNYIDGCAYPMAETLADFWLGWLAGTLST